MYEPKLQLHDRFLERTFLRLIPSVVHPNYLTIFRFLATPVVMLLTIHGYYTYAIPAFLVVAFTDMLDGSLARTRDQITDWGKVYDPVADKLLIGSLVAVLVVKYLGFYLGLAIILIEALFIGLGWWWLLRGYRVQANKWGKIKMNFEVLGVVILLAALATGFTGLYGISETTFYLAIFFALISLFTSGV